MLVHKCDKCKEEISDAKSPARISVGIGYDSYGFCAKCGTRIKNILELTLLSS